MAEPYTIRQFPLERLIIVDALRLGQHKRIVSGFVEVDITSARQQLRDNNLSLTAFLIACVGIALAEYQEVHALQTWRGDLVLYNDVDISTLIETKVNGKNFPVAHVIRKANERSVQDITNEIRNIQQQPQKSATLSYWKWLTKLFFRLPFILRLPFYRLFMLNPHRIQRIAGSAVLTSFGMFGNSGGWGLGIGIPMHNLSIMVGGISMQPRLIDERLQNREFLHLTLSFNHDIVDGAPAVRFTNRLKQLIESCHGLPETVTSQTESAQTMPIMQ